MNTLRLLFVLLVASVIVTACGSKASGEVPFSSIPTEPAVSIVVSPTVAPTENPLNQAIETAWPVWVEALKNATGHIFDWSGDPLGFEWNYPTPEGKCQLYAAWDYLIPSPVESCTGGDKATLAAKDVFGLDDPYEFGVSLHAGLLKDWQSVQILPQDGPFAIADCGPVGGYTFPYIYLSRLELNIQGQSVEFDAPTFDLIGYGGQEYRLPEECLGWGTEDLILPRAEWFTDAPVVTIEELNQQYGQFFKAAILRQFTGDPSVLIEVNGTQYLVEGNLYPQDSDGVMLWPFTSYDIDSVPAGTGIIVISKRWGDEPYYGCFLYDRELPQISEWLDPHNLEGQYVRGVAEDVCFDVFVTLEDGRGVFLYGDHVFTATGDYAYGEFAGYVHIEFDSMRLTGTPRDPVKDTEAIRLAEEIRALPGDWYDKPDTDDPVDGPIEACWILESNWSYLPGLSAGTVEWLCGTRLSFWYRFAVTNDAVVTLGPWLVFTARVPMAEPVVLTTGDVRRIDFRTFIEVGKTCNESDDLVVWVNQVSEGEVKSIRLCVARDEYLTVLPKTAINQETWWNDWIPEDPMVFRVR
jgi:hypothetical protein